MKGEATTPEAVTREIMMRITTVLLAGVVCMGFGWAAYQATAAPDPPLPGYVPAGALLYLQAKDFSSLLADWNGSAQKQQWLQSSNYEVFSRSRLLLRLKDAGRQFSTAAGLPPDMNFLTQMAGKQSCICALRYRQTAVSLHYPAAVGECDAKPTLADASSVRNPHSGRSHVLFASRSRVGERSGICGQR